MAESSEGGPGPEESISTPPPTEGGSTATTAEIERRPETSAEIIADAVRRLEALAGDGGRLGTPAERWELESDLRNSRTLNRRVMTEQGPKWEVPGIEPVLESDTEVIQVLTEQHILVEAHVPKDPELKRQVVRSFLNKLETTPKSEIGYELVQHQRFVKFFIEGLNGEGYQAELRRSLGRLSPGDAAREGLEANQKIGKKLGEEVASRQSVHEAFENLTEHAGSVEDALKAGASLSATAFNFFFHDEHFRDGIKYLEKHALEYIAATQDEKPGGAMEAFHRRFNRYLIRPSRGHRIGAQDAEWIGRAAERMMFIMFRFQARDILVPKEGGVSPKRLAEQVKKGDVVEFDNLLKTNTKPEFIENQVRRDNAGFIGNFSKGVWATRRAMNPYDALRGSKVSDGTFPELLKGVEFGQQDFLLNLANDHAGLDRKKIPEYRRKALEDDWIDQLGKLDFETIDSHPMSSDWAYNNVTRPEGIRDAVAKDSNSFIRNPSEKSLLSLIDLFNYSPGIRWENKPKIVENFIDWTSVEREVERDSGKKEDGKPIYEKAKGAMVTIETGRPKYEYETLKSMVDRLTGYADNDAPRFIKLENRRRILKHLNSVEKNVFKKIWGEFYVKAPVFYGINFLLGIIQGIIKAIISGK